LDIIAKIASTLEKILGFHHLLARKQNLEEEKKISIQANSFIIVTCLNPVYLSRVSGKWVSTKTDFQDGLYPSSCQVLGHTHFYMVVSLNLSQTLKETNNYCIIAKI
jgi:hypothetical protein